MRQNPQLAIDRRAKSTAIRLFFQCRHLAAHTEKCRPTDIVSERLQIGSKKLHTVEHVANAYLAIMQFQFQMVFQKIRDLRNCRAKETDVGTDKVKIIDIAAIVPTAQIALDEIVEFPQIDIAQQLTRQVADGQSAAFWTAKEAFFSRKIPPSVTIAVYATSQSRVEQNDFTRKIFHEVHIHAHLPRFRTAAAATLPSHVSQTAQGNLKQQLAVDVHKISANVHFQDIARFAVVLAFLQDMVSQSVDAEMSATMLDTRIAVENKSAFQHLMHVVVIQMMHDAVAEVGSENLAKFRVVDQEARAWARLISARPQVVAQRSEVFLEPRLKESLVGFAALVATRVEISLMQVGEQLLSG